MKTLLTHLPITKLILIFLSILFLGGCQSIEDSSYTVTATAGVGGSITQATTTTYTVTPDNNYTIHSVTGCNGSLAGDTYTLGAITADCTVVTRFNASLAVVPTIIPLTVSIDENVPVSTIVGKVEITDSGDSDILSFTLNSTVNFKINSTGDITTKTTLDYETTASYSLTVYATNSAGDSASVVVIIDINDTVETVLPTVVPTIIPLTVSINENIPVSTIVGKVEITDSGDSDILSFTLNSTVNFKINSTGDITTKTTLDYETTASYSLTVYATNSAGNSASVTVIIDINDIVEVAPVAGAVLTRNDFIAAYQGRWSVPRVNGPTEAEGGHDYRRTSYSLGVYSLLSDGTMKLKTHSNDLFGYAHIEPPEPLLGTDVPIANVLSFGEISPPTLNNTPNLSGTRHHGWYIDSNGNEFVSMKAYYAVTTEDHASQMKNDNGFYTLIGETIVPDISTAYYHNKVAGYMCAPPESQGSRWDYMLGLVGTAGAGSSSSGLSLLGVKWKLDGSVEKPFANALIMHDWGNDEKTADYSDSMLQIRGCAWIETTIAGQARQAIIFTANRAKGVIWYGHGNGYISALKQYINKPADYPASPLYYTDEPTAFTLVDPYSSHKGYHSEGNDRGFFIVDASKLEQGDFQVYPEEWVSVDDLGWFDNVNSFNGTLVEKSNPRPDVTSSFDSSTKKLLIAASHGYNSSNHESTPLFLQFDFSSN